MDILEEQLVSYSNWIKIGYIISNMESRHLSPAVVEWTSYVKSHLLILLVEVFNAYCPFNQQISTQLPDFVKLGVTGFVKFTATSIA
jgi:hypothetical protein